MNCITTPYQKSTSCPTFTTKATPTAPITLQGILSENGKLYVFANVDGLNRIFLPKARTLISFLHFRNFVLDEVGVLIFHRSQNVASPRRRRLGWEAVLEQAYDRGCGR